MSERNAQGRLELRVDCIVCSLGKGTKRKRAGNYRATHVARARVLASEVIFGFASP